MNPHIEKIKKIRLFLLKQIDGLTTEQINTIPPGFNNNIIWNLAHLVAAQQTICYTRSGLPTIIEKDLITPYLTGTRPETMVGEEEIAAIKERLLSTIDRLQTDYDDKVFTNFSLSVRIKEVYNMDVDSIDSAFDFILYHEGFHTGCILTLRHLV